MFLCLSRLQGLGVVYAFLGDKDPGMFMRFWNTRIQGRLCLSGLQGFSVVYAFLGDKDSVMFIPF